MNLESDIDELLYEYPTTARVHNAIQKCKEIKQIKDLINEDGSFVGSPRKPRTIPNIGRKSAMEIDEMRRWFVENHLNQSTKTTTLSDFDKQDWELLSELVDNNLREMGINPASFAFSIEVDYTEEERES
tara:strand:- start:118 stop:507 length:390 start_codon:yes stop_codon:yes gene_type:complete